VNRKIIIFIVVDLLIFFTVAGILLVKDLSQTRIPVTTAIEQKENDIVITIRAKNTSDSTIKRKLNIFLQDNDGIKRFAGVVEVELKAGETVENQSSKKIMEAGSPPHIAIVEWD